MRRTTPPLRRLDAARQALALELLPSAVANALHWLYRQPSQQDEIPGIAGLAAVEAAAAWDGRDRDELQRLLSRAVSRVLRRQFRKCRARGTPPSRSEAVGHAEFGRLEWADLWETLAADASPLLSVYLAACRDGASYREASRRAGRHPDNMLDARDRWRDDVRPILDAALGA